MVLPHSLRGFEVFLKVPMKIIMRFGDNCVLGKIYIDIYQFGRVREGAYMVQVTFLVYYS